MAQKPNIRPIPGQQRPLTEEEKKVKIMQFLQQKRETFAINILVGLCHNSEAVSRKVVVSGDGRQHTEIKNGDALVDMSVALADKLIEKLYPLPE